MESGLTNDTVKPSARWQTDPRLRPRIGRSAFTRRIATSFATSFALAAWALALGLAPTPAAALVRSGTGFFVSPSGHILTSAHVVDNCQEIAVFPPLSGRVVAKLRASSSQLDVALLVLPDSGVRYVVPQGVREPLIGTHVRSLAYGVHRDNPERPVLLAGSITGRDETRPTLFSVDMQVDQGTSGAPVLDQANALVGVVIGHYTATPERGVMVSSAAVRAFLNAQKIHLPLVPEYAPVRADPSAVLRDSTLLVQCIPRQPIPEPRKGKPR